MGWRKARRARSKPVMESDERKTYRGIVLFMLALLFLAAHDATAKYLSQSFPLPLLVWARFTVHFLLVTIFLGPSRRMKLFSTHSPRLQITRALFILAVSLLLLGALRIMPLAETTAIFLVSPFLLALIAVKILGEKVDFKRWLMIVTGFCGALLIARPGGALSATGVLLALAAALCGALYQMQTRQLSLKEDPLATLFYTALTGTVMLSLSLPWFWPEHLPNAGEGTLIVLLGLLGTIGHLLLIFAFRRAPASLLAPFNYAHLLWATLFGWLIFGQLPDAWSFLGIAIIAGSGLLLIMSPRPSTAVMGSHGQRPVSPIQKDCKEVEP